MLVVAILVTVFFAINAGKTIANKNNGLFFFWPMEVYGALTSFFVAFYIPIRMSKKEVFSILVWTGELFLISLMWWELTNAAFWDVFSYAFVASVVWLAINFLYLFFEIILLGIKRKKTEEKS